MRSTTGRTQHRVNVMINTRRQFTMHKLQIRHDVRRLELDKVKVDTLVIVRGATLRIIEASLQSSSSKRSS